MMPDLPAEQIVYDAPYKEQFVKLFDQYKSMVLQAWTDFLKGDKNLSNNLF